MRKLDFYILRAFLGPFVMVCTLIVGLYVVIDCFGRLDDFARIKDEGVFSILTKYYLANLPGVISQWLLPIITVMATVFCLSTLTRYHEITAIKASGISMQRQFMPVVFAVLGICAIDYGLKAYLVPHAYEYLEPLKVRLSGSEQPLDARDNLSAIINNNDLSTAYWHVNRLWLQEGRAQGVTVTRLLPDGHLMARLAADSAVYDVHRGGWVFTDTMYQDTRQELPTLKKEALLHSDMTPMRLFAYQTAPQHLSNAALKNFGQRGEWYLELVSRPAFSLSSLILFLWCIALIMRSPSAQTMVSVCYCVLMTLGYYGILWIILQLGHWPLVDPPTVIYGAMAALLLSGGILYARIPT